jgi:hypothetical protein
MKATSYTKLNTYEVDGNDLTIYWGEEAHAPQDDEVEPYWTYEACRANATDSRAALVEKIMATRYPTYGAEIAAMANGGSDAEEHEAFRAQAKSLADGWVSR